MQCQLKKLILYQQKIEIELSILMIEIARVNFVKNTVHYS